MSISATRILDIVGRDGRPFSGRVSLGIKPEEGTQGTNVGTGVTADAEGRAVYRQIVPGRYRLRIVHESGKAEVQAVVSPGENRVSAKLE